MIAHCFIAKENDEKNQIYFDDRNLVIRYRNTIHRLSLKQSTQLTVERKKYMLPIIAGGLLGAFSLLMIWNNLYNPWPVLITFLLSITAFYFGWVGSWMLTAVQPNSQLSFPIPEQNAHLKRFTDFFNHYQHGNTHKYYYHITPKGHWEKQQGRRKYTSESLKSQGFIHACEQHQLEGVLDRFYKGQKDLVILVFDALLLSCPLKYEAAADVNELFPHIYGEIDMIAIKSTIALGHSSAFSPDII